MFALDAQPRAGYLLLCVRGELDLESSPGFRDRLIELIQETRQPVVLDLSELRFLDSCGLGALVASVRLPADRRPLVVLAPSNKPVSRLLQSTRLDSLLDVHPSVEAALDAALSRSAA